MATFNLFSVILSPSGLNAFMTGHSYKMSDDGISEILEEWKLFFPRRFDLEQPPSLPAAIEVVLGGVRMRYPSQVSYDGSPKHTYVHVVVCVLEEKVYK